jgi:hypothetical protein
MTENTPLDDEITYDIVARLERLALMAEVYDLHVGDMRVMPAAGVADLIYEAMGDIVDLRAELFNEQEAKKP